MAALGVDATTLEHQVDRFDDTLLDELGPARRSARGYVRGSLTSA